MEFQFPQGFVWGSATAALQIEGATREDGRGDSQWDVFCREHPERIWQQATPDLACDHYHRWAGDVALMKALGHTGYRLSIAWPRIIPDGTGAVNEAGVAFYRRLFAALIEAGIEPNVTLYHWDLPQPLARAGGWENPATMDAFLRYARVCFEAFGDQVKLWATFNEPSWSTLNGYVTALHPPLKHDYRAAVQVAYTLMVTHARTVALFHGLGGDGKIGIVQNMCPVYPATDSPRDAEAARIADAVYNRWFIDPALLGRFPEDAVELYRRNHILPEMRREDLDMVAADSVDFIGVNYYFPHYASADATETLFGLNTSGNRDEDCHFSIKGLFKFVRNPKGRYTDWAWEIYPPGLRDLLARAHRYRPGLPIYVTENGIGAQETLDADGTVDDQYRIDFVREHLEVIHGAIADGMNVRGYYMWALMDNFSWLNGYKKRYGFLFIDRETMRRVPKKSAFWYREVARRNGF
ncbi:GH1 family beta-glucosidase [Azospirillum thermophilum]|uniref:Beta-glucosidase n=1 Tax=Azospirillum thermophilum TaxID=2202148 RepID=A0A2S2CY76_9PROT|nr:GH1 family beta-glucosidase [Azospirillum thermophilum]AWK89462.1 beta-glucosidase [Azospirillum thermophilum]